MRQSPDELIDIVDDNDRVVTTAWRSRVADDVDGYRRAVLAFLVDEHGRLCFLRRTEHKSYLPSHFAIVGGCVQSGESYEAAFAREVAEEVNIPVEKFATHCLGYVTPRDIGSGFFKKVYEIRLNSSAVVCNPDDFCEYRWMTRDEFLSFAREGSDKVAPDLCDLVTMFYGVETK